MLARLDLLSGRLMNVFQLAGNGTSLLVICQWISLFWPAHLARVHDLIESFSYLSKATSTLEQSSWKWLKTALVKVSDRSPNVTAPAGLPIACTNACPFIIVQVFSSVAGRSSVVTPSLNILQSTALFTGWRLPAVSARDNGTVDSSWDKRFLRSIFHPAVLATRSLWNNALSACTTSLQLTYISSHSHS